MVAYPDWLSALDRARIEAARAEASDFGGIERVTHVAKAVARVLSVKHHAAPWPSLAERQAFAHRLLDVIVVEDAYPATQPIDLIVVSSDDRALHAERTGASPPTLDQFAEHVGIALQHCPEWQAFLQLTGRASAPLNATFPRRARWFKRQLELAGNLTPNRLEDFGGPDGKTTKRVLKGFSARDDVLQKIIQALNDAGVRVKFEEIPQD
jgi:hypothetical protein